MFEAEIKYIRTLIEEFDKKIALELEAYFHDQENGLAEVFPRIAKVLDEEVPHEG